MSNEKDLYGKVKGLSERHGASSNVASMIGAGAVFAMHRVVKEALGKIEDADTSERCIICPAKKECDNCEMCEGVGYLAPCYDDSYKLLRGWNPNERFYQYFDDNSGFWILVDRVKGRNVNNQIVDKQKGFPVFPDDFHRN